jgi:hypothetical protein
MEADVVVGHDFLFHDIEGLNTDILADEAFDEGPFVEHARSDEAFELTESQDDGFLPLLVDSDSCRGKDEEEKAENPERYWEEEGQDNTQWPRKERASEEIYDNS